MSLINFSLQNRFAVLAGAIALCALGLAVIPGITIDILPDFKKPVVVSFFSYPGLPAKAVPDREASPTETIPANAALIRIFSLFMLYSPAVIRKLGPRA